MERFGGPEVLHLADLPVPKPNSDEVLIQIAYASVNPIDWKIREGVFKDIQPYQFPLIPGFDMSGIVIAIGDKVTLYKPNDRVYGYCRKPVLQTGTYAEFIAMPETGVARMPNNIGFRDASAVPVCALTAWQALFDLARLEANETVLVHGGAGGVGSFAIQLARNVGAGVLTTASLRNHDLVRALGAIHVIDYAREDVAKAARAGRAARRRCCDRFNRRLGGKHFFCFKSRRPPGRQHSAARIKNGPRVTASAPCKCRRIRIRRSWPNWPSSWMKVALRCR